MYWTVELQHPVNNLEGRVGRGKIRWTKNTSETIYGRWLGQEWRSLELKVLKKGY